MRKTLQLHRHLKRQYIYAQMYSFPPRRLETWRN